MDASSDLRLSTMEPINQPRRGLFAAMIAASCLLAGCGAQVPPGYVANGEIRRRAEKIDVAGVTEIEMLGPHLSLFGTDPKFVGGDSQHVTAPLAVKELLSALRTSCRKMGTEEPLRVGVPDQAVVHSQDGDALFDFQWETLDRDHGPVLAPLLRRYAQR